MILHAQEIKFRDRLRLRGISDTHLGAKSCEEKRLKRDIQRILDEEDSYCILLGDQMECITRQDLRRFWASSVKSEMLEEVDSLLNAQLRLGVETFKPLAEAGKIIGAHTGNHEDDIKRLYSFDIHQELCDRLGVVNLGYSSMVRLTIRKDHDGSKKRNVIIHCHHGHGGNGQYTGASINSLERESGWFEADVFLQGHNHKRHASVRTALSMTSNGAPRLIERDIVAVRTGAFYKTYQQGKDASYGEKKGYAPTKIGDPPHVDITLRGDHSDLHMTVTQ